MMTAIGSVCVYCGSAQGVDESFRQLARDAGKTLAAKGMTVVYGGGRVGLMGEVADAALAHGGKVVGIIPQHIQKFEVDHAGLTELHIVDSMHTRKRMMMERSDAFMILPGGIGTLDEMFEIMTWRQLELHDKPIVIVNADGFWDPLAHLMQSLTDKGFMRKPNMPGAARKLYHEVASVSEAMTILGAEAVSDQAAQTSLM
jgi:uncharacterized protein (TIGR00730 family)